MSEVVPKLLVIFWFFHLSQSFSVSFMYDVSFNFVNLDLFQFSILFLGVPSTPELSELDFGSCQ